MVRVRYKETTPCDRCGLHYEVTYETCSHCSHFDDAQMVAFKSHLLEQSEKNKRLGYKLMVFALLIVVFLILKSMS